MDWDFQQRLLLRLRRMGLRALRDSASSASGRVGATQGLDATVIYHEFTHGVSTRMVGGPQNVATLGSFQGGALGEGWSDAFPLSIFNDPVAGAYVTCNPRGIRSAPYNVHPATYADFGNKSGPFTAGIGTVFRPQVHRDGEIWAATAWDIHAALGPKVTQQLLFDAFRYTPVEPSMVDARNAVLIADTVAYGGNHLNSSIRFSRDAVLAYPLERRRGAFRPHPFKMAGRARYLRPSTRPSTRYATDRLAVVFAESFDGANAWEVTGTNGAGGGALWHVSPRRASSGANAFYYGNEATGTYDTGFRNYGALTSPAIQLPGIGARQTIALEWDQFRQTADSFFFDGGFVRVVDLTAGTTTQVSFVQNTRTSSGTNFGFAHQKVNLQPFAGHVIRIQFFMDTFDALFNNGEGWYVDNVNVSVLGTSGRPIAVTARPRRLPRFWRTTATCASKVRSRTWATASDGQRLHGSCGRTASRPCRSVRHRGKRFCGRTGARSPVRISSRPKCGRGGDS